MKQNVPETHQHFPVKYSEDAMPTMRQCCKLLADESAPNIRASLKTDMLTSSRINLCSNTPLLMFATVMHAMMSSDPTRNP